MPHVFPGRVRGVVVVGGGVYRDRYIILWMIYSVDELVLCIADKIIFINRIFGLFSVPKEKLQKQ